MFLGTYTPKLDDKGRLTLPAKFRDELAGGLVVARGQDHTLAVYPREEFYRVVDKAGAASRSNLQARSFHRLLTAGADEQHPDAQGRITLPVGHREWANLGRECVVNGAAGFIEIWDQPAWEAYQAEFEEAFSRADGESFGELL